MQTYNVHVTGHCFNLLTLNYELNHISLIKLFKVYSQYCQNLVVIDLRGFSGFDH